MLLLTQAVPLVSAAAPTSSRRDASAHARQQPAEPQTEQTQAAPVPVPVAALAPGISATKVDTFTDSDGDGKAAPGQTITYTVQINNTAAGATDATGVVFNDTIDANTTLVGASIHAQPLARDDSYNTVSNTLLEVAPSPSNPAPKSAVTGSLLDNDSIATDTISFVSPPATSTNGGTVSINTTDGSFTYLPAVGFTGTDTFTYTVANSGDNTLTDQATVTITVAPANASFAGSDVWYVDNSYTGANGTSDGRSTRPFTSLTPVNAANGTGDSDAAGDIIALAQGNAAYTTGLVLENNEQLIGNGVNLTVSSITLRTGSLAQRPTLANSGGSVITLAQNNTVSGLNTGATSASGAAITGVVSFGTATINNLAMGAGAARAIDLNSGALTVTLDNLTSSGAGTGINLINTTGTLTISGATSISNGVGINIAGAGFPTVTFSGGLAVTSTAGIGIAAAGGTLNIAGTTNTISSTGGAAADLANVSLGSGAVFSTISSSGSGANGLKLNNVSGSFTANGGSIGTAAGNDVDINAGSSNITYAGSITNTVGRSVSVTSHTGGTVTFSGSISDTGTGVLLTNNAGATISFTGGLSLSTGTNDAFTATGGGPAATTGGTINVTQNNSSIVNTLTTTTGTALKVQHTTIGSSGLTFRSITSNGASGASNGVILDNTGTTAGLTVSANGGTCASAATCTGGHIATKTTGANGSTTQGTGIYLNNTVGVSLDRMQLNDFANYAIFGSNVTGFSLTNSVINGTNGNNNAGGVEETCIRFNNLLTSASFPTAQITNSSIGGGATENIRVMQTSGTLDRLSVTNNTFGLISSTIGNDNFHMEATGNGTVAKVTLTGNTFGGTRGDFIETIANGNSTMDTVARQNKFNDGQAIIPGGGTAVSIRGDSLGTAATHTFDISCNRMNGGTANSYDTVGLFVAKGNGAGTFSGTVVNNIIGPGKPNNFADGLFVRSAGSGTLSVLIQDNQLTGWGNAGIHLQNNDGSSTMNASIFGNTVNSPIQAFPVAALFADNGATAGPPADTSTMNLVVGSATNIAQQNTLSHGAGAGIFDVNLTNFGASTTFRLSKNGSSSTTAAGVIADDNVGTPSVDTTAGGGTITLVTTLPTVPATPAGCSIPASPESFDGDTVGAQGDGTGMEMQTAPETTASEDAPATSDAPAKVYFGAPQPLVAQQPAQTQQPAPATASNQSGGSQTTASDDDIVSPNPGASAFPITIGTLKGGESVTIKFQVTVNTNISVPQVSNQGTVSGGNFSSVLTDDPDVAGTNNPTVTQIALPTININNASVAEPGSGTTVMPFTVTLSTVPGATVTVNYATANGGATPATGGADCNTAGVDYVTDSGTLTFAAGQTVQTIAVKVCSDATAESNENFLVNLSSPSAAVLGTSQATGTITNTSTPGTLIISEIRTSGPGGLEDDFVELYNNTNSTINVSTVDASAGWALVKKGATCTDTPVIIATIPNGTQIPARGHYLLTGSQYSLTALAGNDQGFATPLGEDSNVALFSTANLINLSSSTRLDAVGFGTNTTNNCGLLSEGNTLPLMNGSTLEYSFFRDECGKAGDPNLFGPCTSGGTPVDTGDNLRDFIFADTQATQMSFAQRLGAPGPQSKLSPINRNSTMSLNLLDPAQSTANPPNRVRDFTSDPANNSSNGTLAFRRTVTNNTGGNVTRLRFRIVDVTTFPVPGGTADLRARTSSDVVVTINGNPRTVRGTTLEAPTQPNGGGFNSTLSAGTVTLAQPLANGASIDVQFLFGLQSTGKFRFLVNIEALP